MQWTPCLNRKSCLNHNSLNWKTTLLQILELHSPLLYRECLLIVFSCYTAFLHLSVVNKLLPILTPLNCQRLLWSTSVRTYFKQILNKCQTRWAKPKSKALLKNYLFELTSLFSIFNYRKSALVDVELDIVITKPVCVNVQRDTLVLIVARDHWDNLKVSFSFCI